MAGAASEKKPNSPVTILPDIDFESEEFVSLEVDEDLFGTGGDLAEIVPTDDEGTSE